MTFYHHILLSEDFFTIKVSRKKSNWFHSIVVLTNEKILDKLVNCTILHFYGEKGSPVLEKCMTKIRKNVDKYHISLWFDCYGVDEDIRVGNDEYESGCGVSELSCDDIIVLARSKWGDCKIPYAHQRKESYNCIGFSDDLIHMLKYGKWNGRIETNHRKYMLTLS